MKRYRVEIIGPDDVEFFDDEIKALKRANEINKIWKRYHDEHGWNDVVLSVAIVYEN